MKTKDDICGCVKAMECFFCDDSCRLKHTPIKKDAYDGTKPNPSLVDEVGHFEKPSPRFLTLVENFEYMTHVAKRSKQTTYGAYWKGERMKTPSGKMSWNSIGASKNAIRHAISYHLCTQAGFKSCSEACAFFEKAGILTYKELN